MWQSALALAVVSALTFGASAQGPTARKLKSLGSDVAVPVAPPLGARATEKLKGDPVGPIDGGNDRPPYAPDVPKQSMPGGSQIPVPQRRAGSETTSKSAERETPSRESKVVSEPVRRNPACLARLQTIAIAEAAQSPQADDPGCVVPDPVMLRSTRGKDAVEFTDGLLLDCTFALKLADFTASVAQPLARHHLDRRIDMVLSGEGFVCRRRNNALTGKLSEHAVGNATDWVGFKFDDSSQLGIKAVESLKPAERDFLNAVRTSACGYFTTVLGPGSNPAHATHFHFDLGRTAPDKKNPYRICE